MFRDYYDRVNSTLIQESFFNWDYLDLIDYQLDDSPVDEAPSIIGKYESALWGEEIPKVDQGDALLLLSPLKPNDHILLRLTIHFFLACCKSTYTKSNYPAIFKDFLRLYMDKLLSDGEALPYSLLQKSLYWLIVKFPKERHEVSKTLFDGLSSSKSLMETACTLSQIMAQKTTLAIFNENQYSLFFEHLYNIDTAPHDAKFWHGIYLQFLESGAIDSPTAKKTIKKKICDFILKHLGNFDYHYEQIELLKTRDWMDEFDYANEDYKRLDGELEIANNKANEEMISIPVEFPEKSKTQIEGCIKINDDQYSKLLPSEQIKLLCSSIEVIKKEKIDQHLEEEKYSLSHAFTNHYLDGDGKVINYGEMGEHDLGILESRQFIESITVPLVLSVYYMPFRKHFKEDESAQNLVKERLRGGTLSKYIDKATLEQAILLFLSGDYKQSIPHLIPLFESSLRQYFKSRGLNTFKKRGKGEVIGLAGLLQGNDFVATLKEIIDEDYIFTLQYFFAEKHGPNIRYHLLHDGNFDICNGSNAVYGALQIVRLFLTF